MATRKIQGTLHRPDDSPWAGGRISFTLTPGSYVNQTSYPSKTIKAICDSEGKFTAELWTNVDGVTASEYVCTLPSCESFTFVLPEGTTPIELTTLMALGSPPASDPDSLIEIVQDLIDANGGGSGGTGGVSEQELDDAIATRASIVHTHSLSDVTGLGAALASKADQTAIQNLVPTNDSRLSDARVPVAHQHAIADVSGLSTALSAKVDQSAIGQTVQAFVDAPANIAKKSDLSSKADKTYVDLQLGTKADSTALADYVQTSDTRLSDKRVPSDSSVGNQQVAANAAIAWSKIDKSGAVSSDVGAASAAQGALANTALQPGAIGSAVASQNDPRFSDARTPLAHNQSWTTITSTPTTLSGYGITDAATSAQITAINTALGNKANSSDLANYTLTSDARLSDQRIPTDGSVTDVKLGNRIADPALASPSSSGTLTQLLSWITGRIKAITGTTNWFDAPPTSLTTAASHIVNVANPHNVTAAQIGAATTSQLASKVDSTDSRLSDKRTPIDGSVSDVQVASNAAIAWTKISKSGATASDIGAATASQGTKADSALQPDTIGVSVAAQNDVRFNAIGNATSIQGKTIAVPTVNATIPQYNGTAIAWVATPTPDWANPGAIGSGTRNTGAFTSLSTTGNLTIDGAGSSTSSPRVLGIVIPNGTLTASRFQIGGPWTFFQEKTTGRTQIGGYWGLEFHGNHQNVAGISFADGATSDPAVSFFGYRDNPILFIKKANGANSANIVETRAFDNTLLFAVSSNGSVSGSSFAARSSFMVATLPSTAGYPASTMIWCSNGCKTGEATGSGTGVWVCPVGTVWKLLNTTTTVTA